MPTETLASIFAGQNRGKWQCPTCLAYSADTSSQCEACEASRPTGFTFDAAPQQVTSATSFTFASSTTAASQYSFANTSDTGFSFTSTDAAGGGAGTSSFAWDAQPDQTPSKRESPAKVVSTPAGEPEPVYEEPAENLRVPPTVGLGPDQRSQSALPSGLASAKKQFGARKRTREEAGLVDNSWRALSSRLFDTPIPVSTGTQPARNAVAIEQLKRQLSDMQRQLRAKDTKIGTLQGRLQELEHDLENRVWKINSGEILVARPTKRRRINVEGGRPGALERQETLPTAMEQAEGVPDTATQKVWDSWSSWQGSAKKRPRERPDPGREETTRPVRTESAPLAEVTGAHTFIPFSRVFTAGLGEQGELGRGDDNPDKDMMSREFTALVLPFDTNSANTKILQLASGTMTSAILAELGGRRMLVTWGGEDIGMGRGYNPTPDEFLPAEVPLNGRVPKEVAVGNTMLAVCMEDGEMFLSGGFTNSNNKKSFGEEYKCKKYTLTHIPLPKKIDHIAAGQEFVVASAGRDVYIVGFDPTFQFPEADKIMEDPANPNGPKIKMPENIQLVETEKRQYIGSVKRARFTVNFDIERIVASQETMAFVSTDGGLYVCGMNDHGQCGSPQLPWDEVVQTPTRVASGALAGKRVADVRTGQFTVVLTRDGDVVTFGRNADWQLGNGAEAASGRPDSDHTPRAVALPGGARARGIGRGLLGAFAIGSQGELFAWGLNKVADDCSTLGISDPAAAEHIKTPVRVWGVTASLVAGGDKHAVLVGQVEGNGAVSEPSPKRARMSLDNEAASDPGESTAPGPTRTDTGGSVLMQMFANKDAGKWQCKTCLAYSAESSTTCDACEVPRAGEAKKDAAPSEGTGFGFAAPAPTGDTGFSFGTAAAGTSESTGFSFSTAESTGFSFSAPSTGNGFSFSP